MLYGGWMHGHATGQLLCDPTEDVTTEYFYDEVGRQAAVKAPTADGTTFAVTRTFYDDEGRVTVIVFRTTGWPAGTVFVKHFDIGALASLLQKMPRQRAQQAL